MTRPLHSNRFVVRAVPGAVPTVMKTGAREPLAREARALRILNGRAGAPALVSAARGRIVTAFIDGASRQAADLTTADARRLGARLRAVHDTRVTATGGLPWWPSRATSLAGYRRGRLRDALAITGDLDPLVARVGAAAGIAGTDGHGFRFLHGDLSLENVLWDPSPRLVDWEFWRMGDPAEDLAYLAEVNALPDVTFRAVLRGYGDAGMADRVDRWRALVALDAGLWYRRDGDAGRASRLLARAGALAGEWSDSQMIGGFA